MKCSICNDEMEKYGLTKNNKKVCYACCDKQDDLNLRKMIPGDKTYGFYLSTEPTKDPGGNLIKNCTCDFITNWPGTLKIRAFTHKTINNWGYSVYHVNFRYKEREFYARVTGDSKELVDFIQRLKEV